MGMLNVSGYDKGESNMSPLKFEQTFLIPFCLASASLMSGCRLLDRVSDSSLKAVLYGNGSGYGGERTLAGMSFYQLDANYACTPISEANPVRSYQSVIYFPTDFKPYAVLRDDACGANKRSLCETSSSCPESLEFPPSYYPNQVNALIGYQEFIYEVRNGSPNLTLPSERFVESWCRSIGANFDEGIDVIIHSGFNLDERTATVIISQSPTISDGGGHLVEPFSLTKTDGGSTRIYETQAFHLMIDLEKGSPVPFKYVAKLRATVDEKMVESDLYCRTVF